MIEALNYLEPIKAQRIFYIKKILKCLWIFLPFLVICLSYHFFYFFTSSIGKKQAVYTLYIVSLGMLLLILILHRYKKSKSLSILLVVFSLLYYKYQIVTYLFSLLREIISQPFYLVLNDLYRLNWMLLLLDALTILFSVYGLCYLWNKCNYKYLFSIYKFIKLNDNSKIFRFLKKIKGANNFIQTNLDKLKKIYNGVFIFWPLSIFYAFYKLIIANPSFQQMAIVDMITVSILILSLLFYKLLQASILTFVIAVVSNIGISFYYLLYFISNIDYELKAPLNPLQLLNSIDWYLLALTLLPFVSSVIAIRYVWSSADFKRIFKFQTFVKTDSFGSAMFANLKTIKKMNHSKGIPIGAIPRTLEPKNVKKMINCIKKNGGKELLRIQTSHATLVAPSRTGKGTGIIIPALLEYQGPVFVTDVKGENYAVTKRARELKNRKVIAFDPFGITDAPRIIINPIKFLNSESIEVINDAEILANLICPTDPYGSGNTKHFQSQAAAVIQCLLLYVSCSPKVADTNRCLPYVYDLLCLPFDELFGLIIEIGSDTTLAYGSAARLANSIAGTHPEERSGIFSTARVEMRFIDTPHVRFATKSLIFSKETEDNTFLETSSEVMGEEKSQEKNELEDIGIEEILLSDITKGNMDLFISIPLEKLATQHRLLRLCTGIVFIEMQKARGKIGEENLLMLLDEMPALGYMKQIEEMLVYGGGFGISLLAVSQTIEFLQSVYPKTWRTFFSNQLSIFFGCSEEMTSKFVSEKLGKSTIKVSSANQSSGNQTKSFALLGTASSQSGDSLSETGRPLLMPEEIEKLGDRVVLAFNRGKDPIICHRIDYRERSEWRGLWDENPLHANRERHNEFTFKGYLKQTMEVLLN